MDTSKFIEINSHKFYYSLNGEGKCLILIHGYGAAGYIWNSIIPLIDKQWCVLIPELPGSGISDVQPNASIEDFADMLHAILKKESISQCVVIGHSMGGYIAMEFAKKYASMMLGVGLLHSHVFADDAEKKAGRNKSAEFIIQHGAEVYLKDFTPKLFSKNSDQQFIDTHLQMISATPEKGLTTHLKAMANREDTSEVLRNVNVPVFFGIGEDDAIMPKEVLLKQTSIAAVSQVELFNKSGHMSMIEQPSELAEAMNNFLIFCS
ncbi:MAG: alpha/beta hydrolase [Chitinophagales bacterium]|nr:alpha/beta hydrolase [Chitinophagales bacterium]MBP8754151.1 alpha/beta hydrolase [Chitinophagales bacterium]MBP9189575.1 alpha/beta hydrolase [Chitinophagales bacterium]MBP9549086.1 alpha/beta hydrolase [Chitinophagales bacterium]MBP9704936.1 alpha/beta hydrolase [Chitinophagales bacterium]